MILFGIRPSFHNFIRDSYYFLNFFTETVQLESLVFYDTILLDSHYYNFSLLPSKSLGITIHTFYKRIIKYPTTAIILVKIYRMFFIQQPNFKLLDYFLTQNLISWHVHKMLLKRIPRSFFTHSVYSNELA